MKVVGKFVGIGSFANKKAQTKIIIFHIHIFPGSRCKSCGRGLTFVHRAPGMVGDWGDVTFPAAAAVQCQVSTLDSANRDRNGVGGATENLRSPLNRVDPW